MWYRKYADKWDEGWGNKEYQLGATHEGDIYDYLTQKGLSHSDYEITRPDLSKLKPIGRGSQHSAFLNPETGRVEKYPHSSLSRSHRGNQLPIQTTYLDSLIRSLEKILQLRILAEFLNNYHNWLLTKKPELAKEIPIIEYPNINLKKLSTGAYEEDLLPEEKEDITRYVSSRLLKFVKKEKHNYFYIDMLGGAGNVFKVGEENGRSKYRIIDGMQIMSSKIKSDPAWGAIYNKIEYKELKKLFKEIDDAMDGPDHKNIKESGVGLIKLIESAIDSLEQLNYSQSPQDLAKFEKVKYYANKLNRYADCDDCESYQKIKDYSHLMIHTVDMDEIQDLFYRVYLMAKLLIERKCGQ